MLKLEVSEADKTISKEKLFCKITAENRWIFSGCLSFGYKVVLKEFKLIV
jgi:hypothetical protein